MLLVESAVQVVEIVTPTADQDVEAIEISVQLVVTSVAPKDVIGPYQIEAQGHIRPSVTSPNPSTVSHSVRP